MHTEQTVYLSDILTIPMPSRAASRKAYRRKLTNPKLLWFLLPWILEALALLALIAITMTGVGVFAVSLGC